MLSHPKKDCQFPRGKITNSPGKDCQFPEGKTIAADFATAPVLLTGESFKSLHFTVGPELSIGPFYVTRSNPTHQLTDPTQDVRGFM